MKLSVMRDGAIGNFHKLSVKWNINWTIRGGFVEERLTNGKNVISSSSCLEKT